MYCLIPRGNSVREDTISERSFFRQRRLGVLPGTPIRKLENQKDFEEILISPCETASGTVQNTFKKENGETVHGSYSWCRLTKKKRIEIGLTYIGNIGRASADKNSLLRQA